MAAVTTAMWPSSGGSRRSLSSLTTCTSLSQAISSIDNSKPAVVLDLGRKLTKAGYAGEVLPRAIIRSSFVAGECMNNESSSKCFKGSSTSLSEMVKFFRQIYNSYLLTMPRERRVVIVESLLTSTQLRETICEALLEVLSVPSVLFIPSHLCATFPFNTKNALVVDVGYMETFAVPIAEGVTMLSSYELSNIGAQKLENRMRDLVRAHGRVENGESCRGLNENDWKQIEESNLIEDICVRYLFCSPFERYEAMQINKEQELPSVKDVKVPLGAAFLVIPGFIRETACEVFFERGNDDPSLAQMIHSCVEHCPIDMRRKMFESVLLMGGPTLIPGFLNRLKAEIADIADTNPVKKKQCESIRFYRFKKQRTELYLGWLGGSMFGSLPDAVRVRSVSREAWLEEHILPDWSDYVQHGIPCGILELER